MTTAGQTPAAVTLARSSAGALVAALAASGIGAAHAADPPPARAVGQAAQLMQRAGAKFAEESRGVIGFRSHAVIRTSPRFVRPDQIDDAWIVHLDGRAVLVRGGDATGPAATESAVHQPYDARYVSEYRYALAPCGAECPAGTVAVAYDTDAHDAAHGRGIVVIDERTARVLKVIAAPFVLPRPADAGTLTTTWGPTAAGWRPISTEGTFSGRIGPFGGHATLTQQFTGYTRYPDVASAERGGAPG